MTGPSVAIGVVADSRRRDIGEQLAREVRADYISIDQGDLGCTRNHVAVWKELAMGETDFVLVLEDDAVPVDGFRDQLTAALEAAPAPIVSLYLGRGYVDDQRTKALLHRADVIDAHWVTTHGRVLHAVALAVRGDLLPSMIEFLGRSTQPIDRLLSRWTRAQGHKVAYSIPSLVNHRDEESLVTRYRRRPRTAWRIGGRDEWCSTMIAMT